MYTQKRCRLCHVIGGEREKVGPNLSGLGKTHDQEWLREFLLDPKGTIPGATTLPAKATKEELSGLVDYLLSLN